MSVLLVVMEEQFWAESMKRLGGGWCQHESAHTLLQSVMQKLKPVDLLSAERLGKVERCFTYSCQPPNQHFQVSSVA